MSTFQSPPKQVDLVGEGSNPDRVTTNWFNWFTRVAQLLDFSGLQNNRNANLPGISVTITTAKLTAVGVNGSMTFTNGILTSQTQAT
jgi:hypothetical protein